MGMLEKSRKTLLDPRSYDGIDVGHFYYILASIEIREGNYKTSYKNFRRSVGVYKSYGAKGEMLLSKGMANMSLIYSGRKEIYSFEELIENSANLPYTLAVLLHNYGDALLKKDEYANALLRYQRACEVCNIIGDKPAMAHSLNACGVAAFHLGNKQSAKLYYNTALQLSLGSGETRLIQIIEANLAEVINDIETFGDILEDVEELLGNFVVNTLRNNSILAQEEAS